MAKKTIDPVGLFIELNIKKDYKKALQAFEKLLLKDHLNTSLLFQLGNVHSIIGKNPRKAIEVFNFVLKLDPKFNSARYNRAVCSMEIKQYKQAIKDFCIVLKAESTAEAYKQRALCYEKTKDFRKSIVDLKKCIELMKSAI